MHIDSVEVMPPPGQVSGRLIQSWRTEGYVIALHAYGDRGARIYCTPADGITVEYGAITYDEVRGRNFITWSEAAENQLERYKRDHWDSKFYAAMYRDAKGRS